ncbi:MAG: alpha/beta fold hydrolase [Gammaproteobacteria bacterium]|nr:alpha/beta fold hydrolase [Gammaproteobacteria bacterium]MDH5617724.1 alpha/beta fold hydrolase [Gammaproteobacteria bacterium]
MKGLLLVLVLLLSAGIAQADDCVVLLHGLMRGATSMNKMQRELDQAGFITANIDYPSRDHTIEELADIAVPDGLAACREHERVDRIHFVTHSLGGILVRQYLSTNEIPELGRVVMLGPPNQGSVAADEMIDVPGYDWINGPSGRQLGKGEDSIPLRLGPADFELGVIAGNRTIDPITSAVLPNPDDGRVSVEDTKLEGMTDFVVVEHSHAFMMRMQEPIELTIAFLTDGRFSGAEEAPAERQ